jgi:hypothetical protein
MLYMVEAAASMEKGNAIDAGPGPGPIFEKIGQRFRPQAFYGDASRRHIFMVVEIADAAQMAELMYVLTWFAGTEPKFTPIMAPELFGQAMEQAKKIIAPA